MNEQQIKSIIQSYLEQAQQGLDKENPKLDFKLEWPDLKNETKINEFLKDTTAIANTPGLDGFLVFGYDEKKKKFQNANFEDCGLRDENELQNLIIKRVDRAFTFSNHDVEIDGNFLSAIHLPPSFDKPHVIRNYKSKNGNETEHRVFIRHGTTTRVATKYDYDFMNYDRKNCLPEYSLHITTATTGYSLNPSGGKDKLIGNLTIENNGLRPVAINKILLIFIEENKEAIFISSTNEQAPINKHIRVSNLVIHPGTIENYPSLNFGLKSNSKEFINEFEKVNTSNNLQIKASFFNIFLPKEKPLNPSSIYMKQA